LLPANGLLHPELADRAPPVLVAGAAAGLLTILGTRQAACCPRPAPGAGSALLRLVAAGALVAAAGLVLAVRGA
jgi:hypothetical protein